jgi:hypothetical protein
MNPQSLLALKVPIAVFASLVLAVVNTMNTIFLPGVEKLIMLFTVLVVRFSIHMSDETFLGAELFVTLAANMFLLLLGLILIVEVVAVVLCPTSFGLDYDRRERAVAPVGVVLLVAEKDA